ncbi:MAG: zinc ribbon domain-containing protein [Sedimentisphaerales bacterium]
MSLISCPECNAEISDKALMCPHCGYSRKGMFYGCIYEYRSQITLFGLPLVHIYFGPNFDPETGKMRCAKGIIAIGNIAIGGFATGGLSLGIISFGGLALGLASIGGAAIGILLALGGLAIGYIAIGGAAIGYYALGGGAWGVHALGGNAQDPQAIEFFKRWFGSWVEQFQRSH